MLREIIEIDGSLCNGCGDCVPSCHEGALQIIDGKAHLISDLMCDGLGACVGLCPTGAMRIIKREATPYDEREVMKTIIKGGEAVIKAHLDHLVEHNEMGFYAIAVQVLKEQQIAVPAKPSSSKSKQACSGAQPSSIDTPNVQHQGDVSGQLSHWPIQLHLINPTSPDFIGADLLLAADCSAFAAGDFHQRYLAGKKLCIACPKLDNNQESYIEKLTMLLRFGQLKSLTVLRMDVPCCGGLAKWVKQVLGNNTKLPVNIITIDKHGQCISA